MARRSHGDLNERRVNAVGSQRQRSYSAVRSPRAPRGRRAHAVGTHMIAARTPPDTTIIRDCNEGITKNIDKSRNFNFPNLIFNHFVRLNIAIKRIPHIYPWLCAWDVCYNIFCHLLHIHSGKTGILFSLLLCSLWWVQILFVCLYITPSHYHHCANLSEDIELIKCLSDIYLSSVWVKLSIFPQLSIIQYMGLCAFSSPISLVMIEMIYTLSDYHHQIGSMNYYPMFRGRSWNNGMRCMSIFLLYYFWDSQHHCCNMSIFSSIENNYMK